MKSMVFRSLLYGKVRKFGSIRSNIFLNQKRGVDITFHVILGFSLLFFAKKSLGYVASGLKVVGADDGRKKKRNVALLGIYGKLD